MPHDAQLSVTLKVTDGPTIAPQQNTKLLDVEEVRSKTLVFEKEWFDKHKQTCPSHQCLPLKLSLSGTDYSLAFVAFTAPKFKYKDCNGKEVSGLFACIEKDPCESKHCDALEDLPCGPTDDTCCERWLEPRVFVDSLLHPLNYVHFEKLSIGVRKELFNGSDTFQVMVVYGLKKTRKCPDSDGAAMGTSNSGGLSRLESRNNRSRANV